jgi:DNA polymerase-1
MVLFLMWFCMVPKGSAWFRWFWWFWGCLAYTPPVLFSRGNAVPDLITCPMAAQKAAADFARFQLLGVDIETAPKAEHAQDKKAGLDPYRSSVCLFSVAAPDGSSAVFDMRQLPPGVLEPVAQVPWVAHNAAFEFAQLKKHHYPLSTNLHDSMLMGRPVHGELLSLEKLAATELGLRLDKTEQCSNWAGPLSPQQLDYAAADAQTALQLGVHLLRRLNNEGLRRVYNCYKQAVPVVAQQHLGGVFFDWQGHNRLHTHWLAQREKLQAVLEQEMRGVNYRSPAQLSDWLKANAPAEVLKQWPVTEKTGNLKTGANYLALHANLPVVQPLLRLKALEKLISSYGAGYLKHRHPLTDRLHPQFRIAGTAGGRFSCSNPNTQQPPRGQDFRALFCAEPGRVIVAADYSQIELRVAALLSNETNMLQAYAAGQDLHSITAAAVSGIALDRITPEQRQAAKPVNFGNLYQQRPKGLAAYARNSYGVELSEKEAAGAQLAFYKKYPALYGWQLQQINTARVYGFVETPLGLRRDFKQKKGYLEAEACNHPIQGGAAEVLLCAIAQLPLCLSGLDWQLVNHVHDELVLSVAERDKAEAAAGLQQAMEQGFLEVFPAGAAQVQGLVEVKAGQSWAECK